MSASPGARSTPGVLDARRRPRVVALWGAAARVAVVADSSASLRAGWSSVDLQGATVLGAPGAPS